MSRRKVTAKKEEKGRAALHLVPPAAPLPTNHRPASEPTPEPSPREIVRRRRAARALPRLVEYTLAGGGLSEVELPEDTTLLVQPGLMPEQGALGVVERYDGERRVGYVYTDEAGRIYLDSVSCGRYTYRIERVVGAVVAVLNTTPDVAAQHAKSIHGGAETATVTTPAGWREDDALGALDVRDDSMKGVGILTGDVVVTVETSDLRSGDIVYYETGGDHYMARYYPAPGGRVRMELASDEYEEEPVTYAPPDIRVVGRVVHVERGGRVALRFRPIRDERQATDGDDEWPDVIGEEGGDER